MCVCIKKHPEDTIIITLVEYTLVMHCRACYSVNINTTRITPEAFQKFLPKTRIVFGQDYSLNLHGGQDGQDDRPALWLEDCYSYPGRGHDEVMWCV